MQFYPACGNETLALPDGRTFYQLEHQEEEQFDRSPYPEPTSTAAGEVNIVPAGLAAVAPPRPGDDSGTLTIYSDGMAHFRSDSGDFDTFLTPEERDYNWDC